MDYEHLPFIPARWFTPISGERGRRLIVIHTVESPETDHTALAVAHYFQHTDRKVSAHWTADAENIIQCVQTKDIAWCAPGANRHGLHVELAGYAGQTDAQWHDPYSLATIKNAAGLVKFLCDRFGIEKEWLGSNQIRKHASNANTTGITTHREVSLAFAIPGGHTDPGVSFPKQLFMEMVRA